MNHLKQIFRALNYFSQIGPSKRSEDEIYDWVEKAVNNFGIQLTSERLTELAKTTSNFPEIDSFLTDSNLELEMQHILLNKEYFEIKDSNPNAIN